MSRIRQLQGLKHFAVILLACLSACSAEPASTPSGGETPGTGGVVSGTGGTGGTGGAVANGGAGGAAGANVGGTGAGSSTGGAAGAITGGGAGAVASGGTAGVSAGGVGISGSAAGSDAGGAGTAGTGTEASGGDGAGGTSGASAGASGAGGTGGVAIAGAGGAVGGMASGGTSSGGKAGAGGNGPTGFVHPGLLLTSADIARMKAKIAAQSNPWLQQFNTLLNHQNSSASKGITTPPAIIGRNSASMYAGNRGACEVDAVVAFQNALVFVLTGQTPHADQTVKVLNAYARGVKHFDAVDPERDLEAAILGWLWVSAAELVRYSGYDYTGWADADVTAFNDWIRNVVYADTAYKAGGVLVTPLVNGAGARGAFGLRTKLAIGVYLDDKTIYDQAVDYFFNGKGNGAPRYYINPTTGQTWESGRDQGHAQGGLCRLMETAHIAHNQGNDTLYAWENDALMRAIEYMASYNLGNTVPYSAMQPYTLDWSGVYQTISTVGRGQFQPIYELPYNYWHDVRGMALPYTLEAIGREGTETFSPQNDNPMFATLSYRE